MTISTTTTNLEDMYGHDEQEQPLDDRDMASAAIVIQGCAVQNDGIDGHKDFNGTSAGVEERSHGKLKQTEQRQEAMCSAVRTLLECIGEDPDREGVLDTPSRYAKALLSLTKGYEASLEDVVNKALFRDECHDMVVVKDISIHSLCEHHLLPFTGKMHIGYMPNDTVIGLSKLPRIAEVYARRLQIQERLTRQVAEAIMEIVQPHGVAVVMEASHLCMAMRGVEKVGATTITSCFRGCFDTNSQARSEFLSLVGRTS